VSWIWRSWRRGCLFGCFRARGVRRWVVFSGCALVAGARSDFKAVLVLSSEVTFSQCSPGRMTFLVEASEIVVIKSCSPRLVGSNAHAAPDSRYHNKVAATRVESPPARNFPLSSLGPIRRSALFRPFQLTESFRTWGSSDIRSTVDSSVCGEPSDERPRHWHKPQMGQLVAKLSCSNRVRADMQSVASFQVSVSIV
jgi:hypothetical protein